MRQKLKRLSEHPHARTTVKYGIVSVIATFIDLAVLNGGIKLAHLSPQLSKTAAFLAATTLVYPMQRRWVFRQEGETPQAKQLVQYLGASIVGFLASQLSITLAIKFWGDNLLLINAANWVGFGSVWFLKLIYFRYVVFPSEQRQHAGDVTNQVLGGESGSATPADDESEAPATGPDGTEAGESEEEATAPAGAVSRPDRGPRVRSDA